MAYHDELLEQAWELVHKNPADPKQADLRRSVSAAYYALFHLLISETTAHWSLESSRSGLARMFEHRAMAKAASKATDVKASPFLGEDSEIVEKLRSIAGAFVQLQIERHKADYDTSTPWTQTQALGGVASVVHVFSIWQTIRNEKIAQDFLVSLLIRPRT